MTRDRKRPGEFSTQDFWAQYVESSLPTYGYPKWPPAKGDTPIDLKWWREAINILPSPQRRGKYKLPQAALIEIGGAPQTGKSTGLDKIVKVLKSQVENLGWELIVWDEQHVSIQNRTIDLITLFSTMYENEDGGVQDIIKWEKDSPIDSLILDFNKIRLWNERLLRIETEELTRPMLIIGYRGPIDTIIWYYTSFSHEGDPNFEIPDNQRESLGRIVKGYVGRAHSLVPRVDSFVVLGADQQIAKLRRIASGKKGGGWVTDSPVYRDYSAWCGNYLTNIAPNYDSTLGTGCFVVNGEDSIEENSAKIASYILETGKKLLPTVL